MRQFILLTLFASTAAQAGLVNQVEVKNNTVLFSTESMTDSTISCASNTNKKLRAFSLNTHDGRAMYSLIVTALSKNYAVEVHSALDCADTQDVERIQSLRLLADTSRENNISGSIGLYKHDGVTRLGLYQSGTLGFWRYIDKDAENSHQSAFKEVRMQFGRQSVDTYYSGLNCTGEQLFHESLYYSTEDKTFYNSDKANPVLAKSIYRDGACFKPDISSYNFKAYPLIKQTTHPVCGTGPCKIRED
ncbi:hypothetical protein HG263_17470 [Pseudoalteromonas sp. JBTF-M23]|uniref:Uncharacterized protein n=1 Tax=Pseudoalteromonas caenipelagi TaxID=2726988 RepID=A0A849VFX1_9GAMM|nr:hypothetical protein [Pseudoalteromonas caenipelagi]NOU52322.1 hypothetical protein [Pseudoalteromonas caenipelagi]